MKLGNLRIRRIVVILLTLAVAFLYIARLMQVQIVDADYYRKLLDKRSINTQTIKAVRGEIISADGQLLAANRMGYDVIMDYAFFPGNKDKEAQNKILMSLVDLFEGQGEDWNDALPISRHAPFSFEAGYDDEIARAKKFVDVQDYATAENVMDLLVEKYGLESYSPAAARKIAGIRYTMEQRGFNMSTPYTFAADVDISTVVQVKERGYEFTGVDVEESASRYYPAGDLAPHLIGSIGPIYQEEYQELKEKGYALNDVVGKGGMEAALEDVLRGTNGKREIISGSQMDVIEANESLSPVPGGTVRMTIDSRYQRVGQEALEAQIKHLNENEPAGKGREADVGAVVMVECKTGKVLAAANYPSYDLTTYRENYANLSQDPLLPLVNRAFTGQYAPGSTFKPAVAVASLGHYIVEESSTVRCTFSYELYPQFKCLSNHGPIAVNTALSLSCNIYFYDVGRRTGIELIDETAKELGLGEPTGVEVYEAPGQRSNPEVKLRERKEEWYPGDTLQSSIGQLLHKYTPLQLANYAATIANRGTRMKLTLVDQVLDYAQDNVITPFTPVVAETMDEIPPEAFESVVRGMVSASRTGSARGTFANYPVDVAAKTGTPETVDLPNSTFICFAPAEDPQVAIAVVIEKGWHGYTGAPVAKALLDEYFGFDVKAPNPNGPDKLKAQRAAEAAEAAAARQTGQSDAESGPEGAAGRPSASEGAGQNPGPDGVDGDENPPGSAA